MFYNEYLTVVTRQNEAGRDVVKKHKKYMDFQTELGHLFHSDPIISKILKKLETLTDNEKAHYLCSVDNNMKSSEVFNDFMKLSKDLRDAQRDYFVSLFSYIKMVDEDRKKLFTGNYLKRMDELADCGYFLYYLQTPDTDYLALIDEDWENKYVVDFEQHIDFFFAEIFKAGEVSKNNLEVQKVKALKNAVSHFKNQMYDSCAKELFPLLENDYSSADNIGKKHRKGFEKTENITKKVGDLGYDYYINAFSKISHFYRTITINTEEWDKKEINRNALMHGIFDRQSTKYDCIKLFTMLISFKEISFCIQQLDDLKENFRIIQCFLPELEMKGKQK